MRVVCCQKIWQLQEAGDISKNTYNDILRFLKSKLAVFIGSKMSGATESFSFALASNTAPKRF